MCSQNGRLIVDITLTARECAAVRAALKIMDGFEYCGFQAFQTREEAKECDIFYLPIEFSLEPKLDPKTDIHGGGTGDAASSSSVLCVCELFGVAFSQGVNEMQTLANMSSHKDVQRQTELNISNLQRTW
jgi:hypothetical protein